MTYNFAILKNETDDDHLGWIAAINNTKEDIKYKVIDLTKSDWLDQIKKEEFDYFLTRPPGAIEYFKQLYDERIYILSEILKKKIYPSLEEILIYENKKMLSYLLEANDIPHAKTWIFYHKKEAEEFARNCQFPIVAKTSIGASGSGVKIINNMIDLMAYINKAFSTKGIRRKWMPNLRKGEIKKRSLQRLKNLSGFYKHLIRRHKSATITPQRWYVIFQEYIQTNFEWRCVRIGDSYFAHKKLSHMGKMFSGTSKVGWDKPPENLLDFVKDIMNKNGFLSQALDIFVDEKGCYLVNELQCYFGSKNLHQMIINGVPGRYVNKKGRWIFEKGFFNKNNSFDLRLKHVISLLGKE